MTGFGKVTAELPSKKVTVEIKALNSKQLDLSTRIPSIYKDKEMELRSLLLQSLERGKVEFNIFIEYIGKDTPTQINLAAVENYYNQIKEIAEKLNISVPNDWFQTLLRMPDAIKSETVEPDESEWEVVLETVKDAIKHLCDFRIQEGAMLQKLFEQKIANIATLLKEVEKYEGERIEKIKARIMDNLQKIAEGLRQESFRAGDDLLHREAGCQRGKEPSGQPLEIFYLNHGIRSRPRQEARFYRSGNGA